MNMATALENLGVDDQTLSSSEKRSLDENGFLLLPGIMTDAQVAGFVSRLDELAQIEGEEAGKEVHQEDGTIRLSNLIDKDPMFEQCISNPRLLAGIHHILGNEFKTSTLNARAALPGHGLQKLHADWGAAVEPEDYYVGNSLWLLCDFTPENGATRIVPGTHLSGRHPSELPDPEAEYPGEIKLLAPAGTVVVFNAHTWHGGTLNQSDAHSWRLHSFFCRRDQRQQLDQRQWLCKETVARLSGESRFILDVEDVEMEP